MSARSKHVAKRPPGRKTCRRRQAKTAWGNPCVSDRRGAPVVPFGPAGGPPLYRAPDKDVLRQYDGMWTYDDLIKQVESLKRGNSELQRELQDNSSHLHCLEHETKNMRETWSQGHVPGQDGDYRGQGQSQVSGQGVDYRGQSQVSGQGVDYRGQSQVSGQGHVLGQGVDYRGQSQVSGQGHAPGQDGDYRGQGHDLDNDYSFNEEYLCGERMALYEENTDINDSQTQIEPVSNGNSRGQGQQRSQDTEPPGGVIQKDEEQAILEFMQQFEQERANLIQQIEAEEKNRKWYYDQIEMITRKIRSLPVGDGHAKQTRNHLEFEVSRLRETMHESFGTNEQIGQRREARVQRIRQLEMELSDLQKHREQIAQEHLTSHKEGVGLNRHHSSSDSAHSGSGDESEPEQVTMATQTEDAGTPDQSEKGNYWAASQAIYHGTWPIDDNSQGQTVQGHQDLASVMSFNSTNTSSSHGSRAGGQNQGQEQLLPRQPHQPVPVQQQIHPQQLGTKVPKVEMVYGLLSMLGTHDKDDMSRTLLAMSSSQDSCIAMRQSGCMPLLIQLLHGSDKDSALLGNTRGSKAARARASAALHNIVHSHPDDKRGRREARVLRLLEQIRAHCDQLRESSSDEEEEGKDSGPHSSMDHHPGPAIASLMKLSFDEEHRHAICTLGGLHAIAELLQVDNEIHGDTSEQYNVTMRRYACMALTNLTFGDGTNKALLCSMKPSMESLVAQLFSSNEELCQVAASVVRNLSWKADLASKKTLREVGAVTSLMQAAMRVGKETTLKSILSALWNLSAHCSENKADICAVTSALEFLISSLTYKSPSKTTAIIENGGGILRNVSSHIAVREDYRRILRLHGCLQILLKHLRSPSLTIVSNACGTLWNLSARCAEDQQALWEMGAVNMLRNLVHSKHKMISMGSSAALKNLLAARPNMKNVEFNKQNSGNRPSLHVRKQRALESEIDQNLAETCENVESPRDSPVESRKTENGHFVYPVYSVLDGDPRRPIVRGQYLPRSQSGDNSLTLDSQGKPKQRVSRSGSQDSVGSTHSDISHDRSRSSSGNKVPRGGAMGGSLDRNKDGSVQPQRKYSSDGRTERNPLGAPNSRILQVMQEVAMHAGLDNQNKSKNDSAVFKAPLPVQSYIRPQLQQQQAHMPHSSYHGNVLGQPPNSIYHRYVMNNNVGNQFSQLTDNRQTEDDEKPLDYSLKYRENGQTDGKHTNQSSQNARGQFPVKPQVQHTSSSQAETGRHGYTGNPVFYSHQLGEPRLQYSSAYAETDLDAPDQITDFSARYGAEYGTDQFARRYGDSDTSRRYGDSDTSRRYGDSDTSRRYGDSDTSRRYGDSDTSRRYGDSDTSRRYGDSDPDCADCKLEELRRYNDRLEQTMEDDQVKTFCTEDTPYLSTATSLTDLSTAVKILEEAEKLPCNHDNHCPRDEQQFDGDEIQNFSSKYGENGSSQRESPGPGQGHSQGQRSDADKSSRSGSQTTDPQTGTTVITNYNLARVNQSKLEDSNNHEEECPERSFHDNRNDDGPPDQMKTYCEEGTPLCFSRVSSLSSLHSSEATDRPDKRNHGPLQSINESVTMTTSLLPVNESEAMNSSIVKMPPPSLTPMSYRQKIAEGGEHKEGDCSEKEHKTVTFDDKEQVQETPMMFSRCTSLGSLSSFDTQSVHSSVFSEYSRRASEVVSPSELPDSPSETMPPSPRRTKSPERFDKKTSARQELFPQVGLQQFTREANESAQRINSLSQLVAMGNMNRQVNNETESICKSEAPVVYAEEGTPPVFDNLSQISGMLSDTYDINDKTLVEVPDKRDSHSSSSHGDQEVERKVSAEVTDKVNESVTLEAINVQVAKDEETTRQQAQNICGQDQASVKGQGQSSGQGQNAGADEDRGNCSVSDVSEGEDDLLANVISSAMPNNSKKIRKSSSDNAIRRKLSNSSKTDSSRAKGQGHGKHQFESPSKNSGIPTSAKNSSRSSKAGNGTKVTGSDDSHKSHIPLPLRHRDLARVEEQNSALDMSTDSSRSYAEEDTPFNISNTQSVINKSQHHKNRPKDSDSPIIKKAESLPQFDGDERCRTYATEDTPFSGSAPASPRNDRRFKGAPLPPDLNQDSMTSFATEDTPFSGSVPGSPKFDRARHFVTSNENDSDSVKCFNTEDTPFSGSVMGSPKNDRKNTQQVVAGKPVKGPADTCPQGRSVNTRIPQQQLKSAPPRLDFNQDAVVSYATEGTPLTQSNLPSPKPTSQGPSFNTQMMGNMDFESTDDIVNRAENGRHGYTDFEGTDDVVNRAEIGRHGYTDFEGTDDVVKTFATEGTPLNYSRTGSFSDLSSLHTNFDEKVTVDNRAETGSHGYTAADDSQSDNSSLMEESEELLSEIIQSAMPVGKLGKAAVKTPKVMDRRPEGAEVRRDIYTDPSTRNPKSKVPAQFQPQRTSSVAQPRHGTDQVKTYAVEDTPIMSGATSLSDLTIDSIPPHKKTDKSANQSTNLEKSVNQSSVRLDNEYSSSYGQSNDSVFLHSEFDGSNSLRVYKTEGTPQSFSCNESLSSLGIVDDDSNNPLANQIKALAQTITKTSAQSASAKTVNRTESRSSGVGNQSGISGKVFERHVDGQSSEDQSVADEDFVTQQTDTTKSYGVEDTPVCFSRNSSLSSIHDLKDDDSEKVSGTKSENVTDNSAKSVSKDQKFDYNLQRTPVCNKGANSVSKDQKLNYYKVEHTPICFSRNSSLSSLSIHSDDDDDPDDIALLEDCITSALPPPTRPTREERHRNSHRNNQSQKTIKHGGNVTSNRHSDKRDSRSNSSHGNQGVTSNSIGARQTRNYSSADEAESDQSHDSRYSNWRQQSHKSCDEIFRKPAFDSKGRPCRRSKSQENNKLHLKQHKDVSNKELAQSVKTAHRGSYDSLCLHGNTGVSENEEVEKQRQQIISESQNLTRSIENQVRELTRSAEKSDDHESEKTDSPTDEQNFFMMCSGITEISVESISKQSFPGSMAPDTDDDILDASLVGSYGFDNDEAAMTSSRDTTLTEKNSQKSCNTTLTETGQYLRPVMDASITSEDERALAENVNIVMAEMIMSRMGISGSTVDDERFIEHETLSLVSNDYISDTASEASVTWSVSSDRTSEYSDKTNSESTSPSLRRPRILKPGDKSQVKNETETDLKGVRGKRKPLYSSKSVSHSSSVSNQKNQDNFGKNRSQSVTSSNKNSPRGAPASVNAAGKKAAALRTLPQACSTPVKTAPSVNKRSNKPAPPQRNSSLDQKSPNVKSVQVTKIATSSGPNLSKTPNKSSVRGKTDGAESTEKPRALSKQGTFVKETSNKNAPVIASEDKNMAANTIISHANSLDLDPNCLPLKTAAAGRRKKHSDSSLQNYRNSSGSLKSNVSDSVAIDNDSCDMWSKDHNSSGSSSEKDSPDVTSKKDSKLRRSLGTSQLTNSRKNLNSSFSPNTKIPSPSRASLNKTNSSGNLRKTAGKSASQLLKSNSGSSLAKTYSGSGLIKTGSNSSLKNSNSGSSLAKTYSGSGLVKTGSNTSLGSSRPSTPVNSSRNGRGSTGSITSKLTETNNKQNNKKQGKASKLSGLLKKDKNSETKQNQPASKLPVAKTKGKKEEVKQSVNKRESSPRPAINRNTIILSESAFDGMCRSSTYDKLNVTNERSQVPCHDSSDSDTDSINRNKSTLKQGVFKANDLDRTCREISEVGVEYNLDDAWASHVEKSIEVMSRSIEENKSKQSGVYEVEQELSKLDLSDTPTKRLSKSGSMSEIELEYGTRVNSGTWTKKHSCNDSSRLPNADETSRTLPLKKRSESLNFTRLSNEFQYESDYDESEVWIRRDDKMRSSDTGVYGKSKQKNLKGSSGFLPLRSVVNKVFGSKKVEKQSRSLIVTEKELKRSKKDKETKMNKSEIKQTKAELKAEAKQLKALQKAEAKQIKAEMKASKKDSKLNKSLKVVSSSSSKDGGGADVDKGGASVNGGGASVKVVSSSSSKDIVCQNLNSSLTSLKRSAEDLIDIDKSDDEMYGGGASVDGGGASVYEYQTASLGRRKNDTMNGKLVSQTISRSRSKSQSDQYDIVNQSVCNGSRLVNQSVSDRTEQNSLNKSQSSLQNKSVKHSPTSQHLTKTEMLLARRQALMNSSQEKSDSEEESKRKCIVTTV